MEGVVAAKVTAQIVHVCHGRAVCAKHQRSGNRHVLMLCLLSFSRNLVQ